MKEIRNKKEWGSRKRWLGTHARKDIRESCLITCCKPVLSPASHTHRPQILKEWLDCQRQLNTTIYTENDLALPTRRESYMRGRGWEAALKELGEMPAGLSDTASAALKFSQGSLFLFSGCSPRVCTGKLLHRWALPFDEVLSPPLVDFYSLKLRAHTTQNHSKHLQNCVTITIYNMKSRTRISSI